jgi:uncharacterized protein YjbI with pentapeptide repeats
MPRKSALLLSLLNLVFKPVSGQTSASSNQLVERPLHPPAADREAWRAYWKARGQPWRTEPEIDAQRQEYLAGRRTISPDIEHGIYPFKDIKLSRADVEWLLATHENGRGPVDWNDESQRERKGLDLRWANLSSVNLGGLPLSGTLGGIRWKHPSKFATDAQREEAAINLEEAYLTKTHLEGSLLYHARLKKAHLNSAHLEKSHLTGAHLEHADLSFANLEEANCANIHLERAYLAHADLRKAAFPLADLREAQLYAAHLEDAVLKCACLEQTNFSGAYLDGADLS